MRIATEVLLNLQSQGVHAPARVRRPSREPHPHTARNRDHRRSSTSITCASTDGSTERSTITRRSPESTISIRPVAGWPAAATLSDCGLIVAAAASWPGTASTTTGTNRPIPPTRSSSRNRRRHLKSLVGAEVVALGHHRDRDPRLVGLCHDLTLLRLAPPSASPSYRSPPRRARRLLDNQHQLSVHQLLSGHLRSAHFPSAQPSKTRTTETGRQPRMDTFRWQKSAKEILPCIKRFCLRPLELSPGLIITVRTSELGHRVPIEKFERLAENPNTSWPGLTRPSTCWLGIQRTGRERCPDQVRASQEEFLTSTVGTDSG